MGTEAYLRTEGGESVRGLPDPAGGTLDAAGDFERLIPFEDRSFSLLCYVNPYGDTTFNTVQMEDLLGDLERLIGERCRGEAHSYVWFIGD